MNWKKFLLIGLAVSAFAFAAAPQAKARISVGIGIGVPYGYYGYPYYSSYPYYAGYPYYYSDEPVYEPGPSTYIQRDMNRGTPSSGAPVGESQYSYYCPDPAGYYPQLQNCPKGWLKVVPDAGPRPKSR